MKKVILLVNLSESAYKLLSNLYIPAEPDIKKYEDLMQILSNHFNPRKSELEERKKFIQLVKL